ncbi:MAG: tRNA (guanosine(37)-N1)-methyltransferase TrmD [Planctomycetes bacterium]|nr:tRNA (guanosine(37)-N1)-methyltransferase TrmD [Planctomycetota bacterium]
MRIDVITIFPKMFEGVISQSMLRIAQEKDILQVGLTDLRDYTTDKHRSVDDRPYGGGPGMVMLVEPVAKAVRDVRARVPGKPGRLLLTCPQGRVFNQALARELAGEERLVIVAGHYEGYDERIVELLGAERLSIGDYVLTGGELPAMVVIDAVTRLLPDVLGDPESTACESFASENEGLLEYPQYTRPAVFEGHAVPQVLLSGDHAKVDDWRREQALERTRKFRPDLLNPGQTKQGS